MGERFLDQYSFLHFCVGALAYFWQVSLKNAFIIHLLFEIMENTPTGVKLINKLFVSKNGFGWPGAKSKPDSVINMVGDNVAFGLGWITASHLDTYGSKVEWYNTYIKYNIMV